MQIGLRPSATFYQFAPRPLAFSPFSFVRSVPFPARNIPRSLGGGIYMVVVLGSGRLLLICVPAVPFIAHAARLGSLRLSSFPSFPTRACTTPEATIQMAPRISRSRKKVEH